MPFKDKKIFLLLQDRNNEYAKAARIELINFPFEEYSLEQALHMLNFALKNKELKFDIDIE